MNFNENDLWSDKMNLRLSKLPSAKVLLKLEFDTNDHVLSLLETIYIYSYHPDYFVFLKYTIKVKMIYICWQGC